MSRRKGFSPNRKLVVGCVGAGYFDISGSPQVNRSVYHAWRQDETHRWCRNCGIDWYKATKG